METAGPLWAALKVKDLYTIVMCRPSGERNAHLLQGKDELERSFISSTCEKTEDQQWSLSEAAFKQSKEATSKWIDIVQEAPLKDRTSMIYRRYWQRQNRKAGLKKALISHP